MHTLEPVRTRRVQTNGVTLRVTEAGEPGAPVVVLCHGFPELAFTWRHQVRALAEAGYHVLAPDQRGYGGSDRPADPSRYNVAELTADVIGLLDDVGAERATIVGHDFGAVVAWAAPLLRPERFSAVAGLSLPPVPRSTRPTTQAFRRIFGDHFFYILYFQDQGPADVELARDPATTFRRLFTMGTADDGDDTRMMDPDPEGLLDRIPEPAGLPDWINTADFEVYVDEFTRGGFTAPLNWYRCFDLNWELTADPPASTIEVPALFVGGTADATLAYTPRHRAREVVTGDYREVMICGAGHWLTEERPDDVSRVLLDFLTSVR